MNLPTEGQVAEQVGALAERLRARHWQMAVAESLTGGLLATNLSKGPRASEWFKGAVVAYQPAIKQKVLGVSKGPVVSQRCACEMARGVSTLMEAEIGVAVTGVGGPDPTEGQLPGTVWIAVHTDSGDLSQLLELRDRTPTDVCEASCSAAVDLATQALIWPSGGV